MSPVERPNARPDAGQRGADHLVRSLVERGVKLALGIPGGAISAVFDALEDTPIRTVLTRHESGAVFAAAASGWKTGQPAVVLVTSGPGVLNTVNALASAKHDGMPLLLLVGEVPRRAQGRNALQDGSEHGLRVAEVLRPVAKHVGVVPAASALVPMVHEALTAAMTVPMGPAVLTLPAELLAEHTEPVRVLSSQPAPRPALPGLAPLATMLGCCSRPLIFAGSGCRSGDGPALLLQLAERLSAPVMTTPKAKGVFPETHPLSLGFFGVGGHPSAHDAVAAGGDALLVLGSSLGEMTTSGWSDALRACGPIIQVDVAASKLSRSYPVDWAIDATVADFSAALLAVLPPVAVSEPWVPRLRRFPRGSRRGSRMHPVDAVREIQHVMPANTTFAVDSGEHSFFAGHYLEVRTPHGYFATQGLGSMGGGICGAIGLALSAPDQPVACICGDGGMLMVLGELATAATSNAPVRWFVFNDNKLGMVDHGMKALYGRSDGFALGSVDLAAAAAALGVTSFTARKPGDLIAEETLLREHSGPVLVNILVDPEPSMPKGGRLATLSDTRE